MPRIRYYITGHGLGHASRACQIINTLRRRHPQCGVEVVSDAHPWFFAGYLDPSVPVRRLSLDLGVLQQDSLVLQAEATLQACRRFYAEQAPALVAAESAALRKEGIDLVVADIPPLAFAAAARAGIPAVGLANFTWEWIYAGLAESHPGYCDVLEAVAADYRQGQLLLRLPFGAPTTAIPRCEALPLVARHGQRNPAEVRRQLGIPEHKRLALVSFGGFGLQGYDFAPLQALSDWVFLTEAEQDWQQGSVRSLPMGMIPYPELVRTADVVITKPGYGIVAEAIANQTAVLYTSRGQFREEPLLVAGLQRYTRSLEISNTALRQGDWGPALERLLTLPQPTATLASDGDQVAADRLAELASGC